MARILTLDDLRGRCVMDDVTGCWVWRGGLMSDGAAAVNVLLPGHTQTRTVRGRRAALLLATGEDIRKGQRVWARVGCEEARCCNPEHARRGTAKQWGADMAAAGRLHTPDFAAAVARRGLSRRKLTDEQAAAIRADGRSFSAISREYGVPRSTVRRIVRGVTYRPTVAGASVFSWRPGREDRVRTAVLRTPKDRADAGRKSEAGQGLAATAEARVGAADLGRASQRRDSIAPAERMAA